MTSSYKIADSIQSWQWLLADPQDDQPLYQHQEDYRSPQTLASKLGYWTDDLSIPSQSSTAWQYHTALALGATVVCSAGALMQYTEAGFWGQTDTTASNTTDTITKQAESDGETKVSTPPIVTPQAQTNAAFSSADRDSTCKDSTCKGLEFIDQQLPDLQDQVRQLRTEMQLFQSKHTTQNLQKHRTVLAYRSSDLSRRQAELTVRSQQLEQKFSNVTSVLALESDEVSHITGLLQADADYQGYLQQLQILENDIANEFSNPEINTTQLGELYAVYYQIESQLRQIAQNALASYMYVASQESSDPIWQEVSYQAPLQELVDLSHQHQMLVMEQSTLNQIEAKLTERRTELASLLRQYATMQRQLDGHNQVLQQYVAKRQALQSELT
ncbi:GumC domain-containing protein [Leptothoe spongobia]|uniref:Uncharacterized protein n=1 Tax=Leptothoe spongobia TAU-MAC 1115 TaxID=1967444 RepID=A0A947GH43_9CYAN|nr:hypothetical protein [Leptothoe spongobia]MBT9314724.1 hypothetical protein [Leptothoe spongobia TAU-MAC 1115]